MVGRGRGEGEHAEKQAVWVGAAPIWVTWVSAHMMTRWYSAMWALTETTLRATWVLRFLARLAYLSLVGGDADWGEGEGEA